MKSLHDTALDILKIFPKYFNPQTIIVPVRQHIIHEFSRKMCNFTLPGLDVDESTLMRNLLNFKDFRFSSQGIESTTWYVPQVYKMDFLFSPNLNFPGSSYWISLIYFIKDFKKNSSLYPNKQASMEGATKEGKKIEFSWRREEGNQKSSIKSLE